MLFGVFEDKSDLSLIFVILSTSRIASIGTKGDRDIGVPEPAGALGAIVSRSGPRLRQLPEWCTTVLACCLACFLATRWTKRVAAFGGTARLPWACRSPGNGSGLFSTKHCLRLLMAIDPEGSNRCETVDLSTFRSLRGEVEGLLAIVRLVTTTCF